MVQPFLFQWAGKLGVVTLARSALAFPFGEGGERRETEEGEKR